MDLILREGRLVDRDGTWDVGIAGGRIAQIAPRIAGRGEKELEVGGRLISPAFVEPHIHLDKAFLIDIAGFNEQGTLAEALRLTRAVKPRYTAEDVRRRAARAVQLYAALGTTAIRAHIDVDGTGGLLPLRAVLEVREQFREDVDLQIVAFPHQATLKDPDAYDLLVEALDLGADVLGGFPDVELSPEHGRRHLDQMLALARDRGVPLDVHIDEADDPGLRFLEYLAARTIEEGMTGRVTASHACALSSYPPPYRDRVIGLLRQAGIHVVVCPQTNLTMGGRHDAFAPRRGLAPVKQLAAAGITVAYGQDNMSDVFCPFGCGDTLQNALITALAAHMTAPSEIETVFGMGTHLAARVLGLDQYGLKVGAWADLVVLDAADVIDCIRRSPARRWIVRRGRVRADQGG